MGIGGSADFRLPIEDVGTRISPNFTTFRRKAGRRGESQWLAGGIHIRIRFARPRHAGWEACATTWECRRVSRRIVARFQRLMAIMASKPRALPWAVLWRPFRPCIRTAMREEESHGFSLDGTAQGLRYGRLGSLRYDGLRWFCRFHYEISGLIPKSRVPGQAGSTRGGARGRG